MDRPLSKKNDIEKQAIAALTHLADIIIFVIDPTDTCGYSLNDQMNLLSQVKKMFTSSYFLIVENKVDLKKTDSNFLKISCNTYEGIEHLKEMIFTNF